MWQFGEGRPNHIQLLRIASALRPVHKQTHAMVLFPRHQHEETIPLSVSNLSFIVWIKLIVSELKTIKGLIGKL